MKKIKLKKINDPGHGWLSVPLKLVKELGIEKEISVYSYMSLTRAYLEEDSDMGILLNKLKEKNIEYDISVLESEKTSIRNMASYNEKFIDFCLTIGIGKEVVLYNSTEKDWSLNGTISSDYKNCFFVKNDEGGYYKIAKTTALNYIRPIRERVDEYNMQVNDELLNVKIIYQGGIYGMEQIEKHKGKIPLIEIKQTNGIVNTFYVTNILEENDKIYLSNNLEIKGEKLDDLHNWLNSLKKLESKLKDLMQGNKLKM